MAYLQRSWQGQLVRRHKPSRLLRPVDAEDEGKNQTSPELAPTRLGIGMARTGISITLVVISQFSNAAVLNVGCA
jgi:hypothetical protein